MKKGTEPAFPSTYEVTGNYGNPIEKNHLGISTRLYLAGMLLQGMLSNMAFIEANAKAAMINNKKPDSFLSVTALLLADELIKQGEETR